MKVLQTTMMKGAGVSGHNMGVGPAAPVSGIEEYFQYLFERHSALETPTIKAPNQPHISSATKGRS